MPEETCTLLQEAAQIVNSRPIVGACGLKRNLSDFLKGRPSTGVPSVKFRLAYSWLSISERCKKPKKSSGTDGAGYIPSLLKQKKGTSTDKMYEGEMSSYKKMRQQLDRHINMGRVTKVLAGLDLRVRSADIEYRAPGESKFRITTKLINKLVLIIPVEEQTLEEEYKARECEHEKESLPPTLEQILEGKEQVPGVLKHRRLCYKR